MSRYSADGQSGSILHVSFAVGLSVLVMAKERYPVPKPARPLTGILDAPKEFYLKMKNIFGINTGMRRIRSAYALKPTEARSLVPGAHGAED